jgi:hypothetical protein
MGSAIETWIPTLGFIAATILMVLAVLACHRYQKIHDDWADRLRKAPIFPGMAAELHLNELQQELQASVPGGLLMALLGIMPLVGLCLTAFGFQSLQLSQLQDQQLTMASVLAALSPAYTPIATMTLVTAFGMLLRFWVSNTMQRLHCAARRHEALQQSPVDRLVEEISAQLAEVRQSFTSSLKSVTESLDCITKQFRGLPDAVGAGLNQMLVAFSALPAELTRRSQPLLDEVTAAERSMVALQRGTDTCRQAVCSQFAGLSTAMDASQHQILQAATSLEQNQVMFNSAFDELTQAMQACGEEVKGTARRLQSAEVDPLLEKLDKLPQQITADVRLGLEQLQLERSMNVNNRSGRLQTKGLNRTSGDHGRPDRQNDSSPQMTGQHSDTAADSSGPKKSWFKSHFGF